MSGFPQEMLRQIPPELTTSVGGGFALLPLTLGEAR